MIELGVLVEGDDKCNHRWKKVDKDDSFKKRGNYMVRRVKSICVKCGKENIRRVRKRLK